LAAPLLGCHRDAPKTEPSAAPAAVTSRAPPQASASKTPTAPIGPTFPILAGVGIGPIRFGANVGTIERLMKAPCDVKTDGLCRYVNQAVEFDLKDGVTDRIWIHCHERSTVDGQGTHRQYGFFHGLIPPDLALGMTPAAIEEKLGKAGKSEQVPEANDFHTARRDTYPGMVVEYDRYPNGNLILCGVVLTKSDTK
jgi:hypothetical protein